MFKLFDFLYMTVNVKIVKFLNIIWWIKTNNIILQPQPVKKKLNKFLKTCLLLTLS